MDEIVTAEPLSLGSADGDAVAEGVRTTLARLSRTGALPTLPVAVTRALAALRRPDVDLDEICGFVEADIGIAARVMRLANSALYTRGKAHDTLAGALLAIGLQSLSDLLYAASLRALHGTTPIASTLWDHALATAIAARTLAPRFGVAGGQAFVAGLFHDVGRFAFCTADPLGFETIMALRVPETRSELEQQWYGFDHAAAGAVLAEDWGLGAGIVDAIRWHHLPAHAATAAPQATLLQVADALAHALALGGPGEQVVDAAVLDAHLGTDERTELAAVVTDELAQQRSAFA